MVNHKLFEDNALKAIKSAHRRKWTLIGLVFVVVLGLITVVIFHEINVSRENVIANKYAEIEEIYNQENAAYQQKMQQKKGVESLETEVPDYSVSMARFQNFALKYPKNPYAWQAAIRSSTYFIMNNKIIEAQKELEAVLPYTSKYDLIQIKIRTTLAGMYATQNNTSKALEQLAIVEKLPHNPMPNQSRLLSAQILVSVGNLTDAKKMLNQIISSQSSADFSSAQSNDDIHQAKILLNKIGL